MSTQKEASRTLTALIERRRAVTLEEVLSVLQAGSRMTAFRRLREVGYLSSFTHRGSYYTLMGLPDFDAQGLWFHEGIGFSRAGTLKETVVRLVGAAPGGRTHHELEALVRVRVHNTLLGLVEEGRLGRVRIAGHYLYVSAEEGLGAEQMACRSALVAEAAIAALPTEVIIAVLVEALQASEGLAPAAVIAARLAARGQPVTGEQVERVYAEYKLVPGKKTVEPPSVPSGI